MTQPSNNCIRCSNHLEFQVRQFSIDNIGYPMCRPCQSWLRGMEQYSNASKEAINLWFALRDRGVPAELEKCDGYKTIDIAVVEARVNIEVDGIHHNRDDRQALADLQRTVHSLRKGYSTLRIPNSLVRNQFHATVNLIVDYLNSSNRRR